MAKITAEQLENMENWVRFGNKLGWVFRHGTEDYAVFKLSNGSDYRVDKCMYQDIRATWRDQDKPKLEVAG
ncbi:MAG: hypothetical protein ACR2QF_07240 [Geminicoccaceae bacterium]